MTPPDLEALGAQFAELRERQAALVAECERLQKRLEQVHAWACRYRGKFSGVKSLFRILEARA